MPTPIIPSLIRELAYAVTTDVLNRKQAIAIDRRDMPLLDFLWGKRKTDAGQAGSKTLVNLKVAGESQFQGWNRLDPLGFSENEIDLRLEYEFFNLHQGIQFVHTDLLDQGYIVMYNEARSKNFAKKSSADEINRLATLFEEKVETNLDNFKVNMDRMLHYSTDPLLPPGLDSLVSVSAVTGSIGGKDRATNPLLQHTVRTALSAAAAGNMYVGMTQALRLANLNGRGRSARVDRLFAGSRFIDGYNLWRQRNQFQVNANAGKIGKVDIAISDSDVLFHGMPIEYDPTLDYLESVGTPNNGIPFDCRCYGLASKAIEVRCPPGMDMQVSYPPDPAEQRLSRISLDSRLAVVNTVPNAHVLWSVDPATL